MTQNSQMLGWELWARGASKLPTHAFLVDMKQQLYKVGIYYMDRKGTMFQTKRKQGAGVRGGDP